MTWKSFALLVALMVLAHCCAEQYQPKQVVPFTPEQYDRYEVTK